MSDIVWIDGWVDGRQALAEDGKRYPIPPKELDDGGLEHGTRISFTLRKRQWGGRTWVSRVLLRP